MKAGTMKNRIGHTIETLTTNQVLAILAVMIPVVIVIMNAITYQWEPADKRLFAGGLALLGVGLVWVIRLRDQIQWSAILYRLQHAPHADLVDAIRDHKQPDQPNV